MPIWEPMSRSAASVQEKTVVYNRVDLNVGNGYDVKNGVFTAPVAGLYVFNAGMLM